MTVSAGARTALVVAMCAAFTGVAAWSAWSRESQPVAAGTPTAEELDSLGRYRKALVDFVDRIGESVAPKGRLHVA